MTVKTPDPLDMDSTSHGTSNTTRKSKTLEHVKNTFSDMGFVKQVCCSDYDDKLRIVIIHNDVDLVRAFTAACDRAIKLEELLPNIDIEPHVLHESEVESRHLDGTEIVFKR